MLVNLAPYLSPVDIAWSVHGDVLTIDGIAYDLGPIREGAMLPAEATGCEHLVGEITRQDGEIVLTLRLPHGSSAVRERRFPDPVRISSGTPDLPPFN